MTRSAMVSSTAGSTEYIPWKLLTGNPWLARNSIRKRSGSTLTVLYARHSALVTAFSTRRRNHDLSEGMRGLSGLSILAITEEPGLIRERLLSPPWSALLRPAPMALDRSAWP